MPSHKETRILDYTSSQILDLVTDIEKYPKFLPWCIGAKITNKIDENNVEADLAISFKGFFQKYSSHVTVSKIDEGFEVRAVAIDGPFEHLLNLWHIKTIKYEKKKCYIDFFIDFEFKSKILSKLATPIFEKATNKMIQAFESRARELYT